MKTDRSWKSMCRWMALFLFVSALAACGGASEKESMNEQTDSMSGLRQVPVEQEREGGADKNKETGVKDLNTEEYSHIKENEFKNVMQEPLSTFSIDVDKASYGNVRRYLLDNQLPPKDAVRIEEMVNYFSYNYPQPTGDTPFSFTTELSDCPWNKKHKLVHIGIQGKKLDYEHLKASNLVFLIDVSGSMDDPNKLPLLQKSMKMLVENLSLKDRVAIVTYAGEAGLVLPSTPASEKATIYKALDNLHAGGSTAGGEGIELAYKVAKENLIKGGNNRVILATDGDFNVGISSTGDLVTRIEEKRKDDIYLTICGFGMGNYKDSRMEDISDAGNGNYFYIDNIQEAQKVFVTEMRANMFTIAKDVKIQVEFNPAMVGEYRLIGYEDRVMSSKDFEDDKKDAGELGAGHTVTALYEIIPAGSDEVKNIPLKYQETKVKDGGREWLTLKFRYKPIHSDQSILLEKPVEGNGTFFGEASENLRFASAVAAFGMLLRDSKYKGDLNYNEVLMIAKNASAFDKEGYRSEFIKLVETASLLSRNENGN
ncbi:MAG TPA: VWA domain-containing protein [Bacteroidia bacterium]